MRAILQRVSGANLNIAGKEKAKIDRGLVILLGIEVNDKQEDIDWLCRKIIGMRIFNDDQKAMNLSVKKIDGEVLIVSQFTLHASVKKGNRPSFMKAAKPDEALPLYQKFITTFQQKFEKKVATGEFGADMQITLCNDGPVTILLDSKERDF